MNAVLSLLAFLFVGLQLHYECLSALSAWFMCLMRISTVHHGRHHMWLCFSSLPQHVGQYLEWSGPQNNSLLSKDLLPVSIGDLNWVVCRNWYVVGDSLSYLDVSIQL